MLNIKKNKIYLFFLVVIVSILYLNNNLNSIVYAQIQTETSTTPTPQASVSPLPAPIQSSASSVNILYSQSGSVIGKIYPPYTLATEYYPNHALDNLNFIQELVKIPPSSNNYDNYNSEINLKNFIMSGLTVTGDLNVDQYSQAISNESNIMSENLDLPYFTDYVLKELFRNYSSQLEVGGMSIYTTVDSSTYNLAQSTFNDAFSKYVVPAGGDGAALIASNPFNGYVLALIGGPDWNTSQINMALVARQQGSSMKPLIYIKAFEMGYSPQTIIDDAPVDYSGYQPKDYLGTYQGKVTIDQAINQSLNVPAVKMLYSIGYQNGISKLKELGITLDPKIYYGLPIILGAAEIPLTQMVGAYNAIANGGLYAQTTPFIKIVQNGKTILDNSGYQGQRVIDSNSDELMQQALGDTALKQPLYGSATFFYSVQVRPYGSKDGTSNGPKDVTDYTFIPQLTVGAWAGNVNNTDFTTNATGAFTIGPMVHSFIMQYIQQNNLPVVNFTAPSNTSIDNSHKYISG